MKVIFLDFDGVITTPESKWNLDASKIALVEDIIKATDAKIVVSSSWSVGCNTGEEFKNRDLPNLKGMFEDAIYDVTDHCGSLRGDEIKRWLENHNDIESYVIIDDDSDILEEQLFNFIQTDTYEGITSREVKLAKSILNNEKVINPIRLNMSLRYKWYDNLEGRQSNISQLLLDYNCRFK